MRLVKSVSSKTELEKSFLVRSEFLVLNIELDLRF